MTKIVQRSRLARAARGARGLASLEVEGGLALEPLCRATGWPARSGLSKGKKTKTPLEVLLGLRLAAGSGSTWVGPIRSTSGAPT